MNPTYTMPNGEVVSTVPTAERTPATAAPTGNERLLSHGTLSKPILGLPLARLIPQDLHSMMDYGSGFATGAGMLQSDDPKARLASAVLAGSVIGISAITDYRLSFAKLVPIEVHEVADYAWGVTAMALPFALGYWKTSPKVALMHVVAGAGTIMSSLFTDYRAFKRK